MGKVPGSIYDKWDISMVICDTDIPYNGQPSLCGDRKTFEVMTSTTLPEHLSSPSFFSGVRVTRSLVLYVYFVGRCLSFCIFSFGHWHCYLLMVTYGGFPVQDP
jgi:hypothetical protein